MVEVEVQIGGRGFRAAVGHVSRLGQDASCRRLLLVLLPLSNLLATPIPRHALRSPFLLHRTTSLIALQAITDIEACIARTPVVARRHAAAEEEAEEHK